MSLNPCTQEADLFSASCGMQDGRDFDGDFFDFGGD